MRSRSITQLIVVALGVCAVVAGRPVPALAGDIIVLAAEERTVPNTPAAPPQPDPINVWVPAEDIVATWESVALSSKLYNPNEPGAKAPERSLSLSARVDVVDVNGLIGFDSTERGTLVLDEKPDVIYSKAVPSRYCHFYWPLRYIKKMPTPGQWVSELQPYRLTVNIPMDPNRPYPTLLGRVEWSMYALVNTEVKTVDVPFSAPTDWLTLTPGLEIKIEQATGESGRYQYRLGMRYERTKVLWAPSGAAISIWTHEPTPEVIVTKLDILALDASGKPTQDPTAGGGSGGGSSSSGGTSAGGAGGLVTGTASGSGSGGFSGTPTTFRFTLALQPVQQQLRFILENVPVPSF